MLHQYAGMGVGVGGGGVGGGGGGYGMSGYPWYSQTYADPRAYQTGSGYNYGSNYGAQTAATQGLPAVWGGVGVGVGSSDIPLAHQQHLEQHLNMASGSLHGLSGHLSGQSQSMSTAAMSQGQQGQDMSTHNLNNPINNNNNSNNNNNNSNTNMAIFGGNQSERSPGQAKTPPPAPSNAPPTHEEEKKEGKEEEPIKKEDIKEEEEEDETKKEPTNPETTVIKREEPITKKEELTFDWTEGLFKDYYPGLITNSVKFQIFFQILDGCVRLNDRLLVFSQSLFTLTLLEEFLQRSYIPGTYEGWIRNRSYFRLDGSTSAIDREKLINEFNNNPSVRLFLVSTRAGSLGINLVGANRVIVFDASFNPCHDTQAVCRVYRYGQKKECCIYRLVTDNSLEKRIYDRQVNKQGISDRIVDELNPDAHLSSKEISNLLVENESDPDPKVGLRRLLFLLLLLSYLVIVVYIL